jgi:hypothetical protein
MDSEHIEKMVMDLRADGLDCYTIARKLNLTLQEVEKIVYKGLEIDIEQVMAWMGAHH